MTKFNQEYRAKFADVVKRLPRDKFGHISFVDYDRMERQAKADKRAGIITHLDYFNVSCVLGTAINGPYCAPERSETYHA